MKSWKTTVAGVCAIVAALSSIGTAIANGVAPDWQAAIAAIIAGVGLLMAKDFDATGPYIPPVTPPKP